MLKRILISATVAAGIGFGATAARAAEGIAVPTVDWSFDGAFGSFDKASLQRGFQVYKEVCSGCHSMNFLSYRTLGGGKGFAAGDKSSPGPGFSEDEVKAIAAQYKVMDGPNDQGEMFERPARPSDRFASPFPNAQAARIANNGALPPDLSVIAKARMNGSNYLHALLGGYVDPPEGVTVPDGMYYNKYFPGHMIAMPPPISEGSVTYADGTVATVDQISRDVTVFMTWAAEPYREDRHRLGAQVLLFLVIMTGLLYAVKRKVWADVH